MPAPGATAYRVYRQGGGAWVLVAQVMQPGTTVAFRAGTTRYMVAAVFQAGERRQLGFGAWTAR